MRIFISGPMTGLPLFNFPAFINAEYELIAKGNIEKIYNPVWLDCELWFDAGRIDDIEDWKKGVEIELKNPLPVSQYYRQNFRALCDCDAIAMLPGYENSVGAMKELNIAKDLDLNIYLYSAGNLTEL